MLSRRTRVPRNPQLGPPTPVASLHRIPWPHLNVSLNFSFEGGAQGVAVAFWLYNVFTFHQSVVLALVNC